MKINKLQIKLIIGVIFIIIMYSLILFLEPKENINNNTTNENIYNEIDQTTFINTQNINGTEIENANKGQVENVTKEEFFY